MPVSSLISRKKMLPKGHFIFLVFNLIFLIGMGASSCTDVQVPRTIPSTESTVPRRDAQVVSKTDTDQREYYMFEAQGGTGKAAIERAMLQAQQFAKGRYLIIIDFSTSLTFTPAHIYRAVVTIRTLPQGK